MTDYVGMMMKNLTSLLTIHFLRWIVIVRSCFTNSFPSRFLQWSRAMSQIDLFDCQSAASRHPPADGYYWLNP
jgi:hypothetical protein